MKFKEVLQKYRDISYSEKEKGDRFERLMQAYLETDPRYANQFKDVWMWEDFPGKKDLGGADTGIDLVARTYDNDYWAIQCKCYQESTVIDKPAVDSFITTSGRTFKGVDDLKTTGFAHRLWIATSDRWNVNASEAIKNQSPPVTRLRLFELQEAPVDWGKLEEGIHGEDARIEKKRPLKHQEEVLEKAHDYYKDNDRGKLIMACGTGKTFTSLKLAEQETKGKGFILFLVPSIALLGQTLREWSGDANEAINAVCICSDPEVSKKKKYNDDVDLTSVVDLALPASTNVDEIMNQFRHIEANPKAGMTVVFSTYQSIEVIAKAQQELLKIKEGPGQFDLIICDEAHRTTGVSLADEDESAFTKVHDNDFIKAKKRLYMTATPRLYSDDTKSKAAQAEAVLCSMDDLDLYGHEIYRIGFGEAVERDLLTDYKVLILTLNDHDVPPAVQRMIADGEQEINTDDVSKIIGTINALSKQFLGDDGETKEADPEPMKRAVAFCANIATSKKIASTYNTASEAYLSELPTEKQSQMVSTEAVHMDGTMSAPERDKMLSWLKEDTPENECRIIANVRVLSEGVDVPSLDSVLFLSGRNSQVDVVQSVGRVMRKSPGKKYGYIIIPVVVPADVEADVALDDNERYKVVWTVLNALRAHDDRFNATVNKIELNKKKPNNILVGRPEYSFDEEGNPIAFNEDEAGFGTPKDIAQQLGLQFEELQNVVFARMVKKVGDRRYWEQWAKDVAVISNRQIERIEYLIENKTDQRKAFESFLLGLQQNINTGITKDEAIEMLAQHIITKPIFEALFEDYSFEKNNAVSVAMQKMINKLEGKSMAEESEALQKFYNSVRKRAEGIDNASGKQRIIIELYDKFFKTAFPKLVDQLGIVYTPIEVVDFIIHSVNDVLKQEFGRTLTDENIHILDPFTGTGTFITRLLQSDLIKNKDLERKFHKELHANEIVLLAYYIAAVNIENAFHDRSKNKIDYEPFQGMVLTDTFQLGEIEDSVLFSEMFPQNSERIQAQQKGPIRVIVGNPPYSVGQESANDNAANQKYENLERRIGETYAAESTATNRGALYDAYMKAFRWSTDRLDKDNGGVIAFVSNGSWLDGNSTDGFRKTIEREFSSVWVFNTRGNARTQGELRKKEAGNVFGSGSRTPISITLLIKKPNNHQSKATIRYYDIGDYLSHDEKLETIANFESVSNSLIDWKILNPNEHGDWINQRNELFDTYIPVGDKKGSEKDKSYFNPFYSNGVKTNRDAWVYNFNKETVESSMKESIRLYNEGLNEFELKSVGKKNPKADDYIDFNQKMISWTREIKWDIEKGKRYSFEPESIRVGLYRPFTKQHLYFNKGWNNMQYLMPKLFPSKKSKNLVISMSGVGASKDFSCLISDRVTDLQVQFNGQCFPLYYFEEKQNESLSLFDEESSHEYKRRDGISDFILTRAKKEYGKNVTKEDIFYYVYGILHSPDYRSAFSNDLKKMLPRIPMVESVKDFWHFSNSGRKLGELHLDYEKVSPFDEVNITGEQSGQFNVEKMRFPKKDKKDTILFNSKITIVDIPKKAYEFVVNGKSAIEWIMERYQVKMDKKTGIINDPNDWSKEVGNPRYILDLLLSVINVSVQTVDIVNDLPKLKVD